MIFPEAFIQRLRNDYGNAISGQLLLALQQEAVVSVRCNPAKSVATFDAKPVPWNPYGHILHERPLFIEDPLWHAGAYYVQEASSMFLHYALQQLILPGKIRALDACAAPGGKSTLLLSALPKGSVLVANEVIASRNAILRENLIRWGNPGFIITQADPSAFGRDPGLFDLVLADAPCSGEGLFRKDKASIAEWSIANTELCALRQQRILNELAPCVKEGGYLIYSTCTYNPAENFDAPSLLLQQGFECTELTLPPEWQIRSEKRSGIQGYSFFPGSVQGEGFFLSIFRKKSGYATGAQTKSIRIPQTGNKREWSSFLAEPEDYTLYTAGGRQYIVPLAVQRLLSSLYGIKTTYAGMEAGEQKGNDYIPSHAMALSSALAHDLKKIELTRSEALQFLKKESIQARPELEKGLYLVCYQGLGLGWVKNIGSRFNNLLPASYRIRKQLSDTL